MMLKGGSSSPLSNSIVASTEDNKSITTLASASVSASVSTPNTPNTPNTPRSRSTSAGKLMKTLSNLIPSSNSLGGGRGKSKTVASSDGSISGTASASGTGSYIPPTPPRRKPTFFGVNVGSHKTNTTAASASAASAATLTVSRDYTTASAIARNVHIIGKDQQKKEQKNHRKNIKRYRGFSTSISSLFLDEQVVCGAVSWCGLLASSRTEYLLGARTERLRLVNRVSGDGQKSPSKVLGLLLIGSVAFISLTYLIWGFGETGGYYGDEGYHYKYYGRALGGYADDVAVADDVSGADTYDKYFRAKKHYVPGVMRFCDYDRRFWAPARNLIWSMVKNNHNDINENDNDDNDNDNDSQHSNSNRNLGTYNWYDDQGLASNLRSIVCVIFLVVLGIFGRRRRMQTRFAVLKARIQDDQLHFGRLAKNNTSEDMRREDKYAGACSHTLCGCYPVDRKVIKRENEDEEDDIIAPGFKKKYEDWINTAFSKFMACCFGKLCNLWCQCFSICALAQEAREVRLLVPPKMQRVDFITHQPWKEYFTDIYNLRINWKDKNKGMRRKWGSHLGALSLLSRSIVVTFVLATAVIILTEQINPRAFFSWADACVLLLTFVQSFVVLGIVHGLFHKSDLSLDAVIKFFAAGFIIATPTAFVFETIVMFFFAFIYYIVELIFYAVKGVDFQELEYDMSYRICMLVGDILQAFMVAACVEELCKYYAFRTVEHPDLIFVTGLNREKRDRNSVFGGNVAYSFSSHNNALISRSDTFETEYSLRSQNSRRSHRGIIRNGQSPGRRGRKGSDEDEPDVRTVRQRAAALTTAMISCAVGLACAENFIYVFFLSGSNTQDELTMLVFRSIFPVHALCAAMQSVGIIKKFLEETDQSPLRIGVGKIVLPAIMLHGTFDSVLMIVNSIVDFAEENAENQGGDQGINFVLLDLIAAAVVIGVLLSGLLWYYVKNRNQKAKLKLLEGSQPTDGSNPQNMMELL